MSRQRLLIVGPYPPPYGGIASQIANTAPYFVDAGFDVDVLSWATTDASATDGPIRVERVALTKRAPILLNPATWGSATPMLLRGLSQRLGPRRAVAEAMRAAYVERAIREGGYQIVHYFMLTEGFIAPVIRRRLPHVRQVVTVYGEIFDHADLFGTQASMVRDQLEAVDHRLSSSRYCAQSVEALGIPSDDIEPLYYGVDLERFSPTNDAGEFRRAAGIAPDAKMIFFFARLLAQMGADVVAEAIPPVLDAADDAVFVVAGADGDCVPRFRELEARYPGRIHLRVNVPGSEVPRMYAACDLLLAPTRERHACMGMSIKEAMASGRVGICSRSGGIPEAVIDGETGILLPTGPDLRVKASDMIAAILDLIRDDERRRQMGVAARRRAEAIFDNRQTAARLVEIYRGLLAR